MFWWNCWFRFSGKTGGLFWVLLCNGRELYLVVGWFGFGGRVGGEGGWTTLDCSKLGFA